MISFPEPAVEHKWTGVRGSDLEMCIPSADDADPGPFPRSRTISSFRSAALSILRNRFEQTYGVRMLR